MAKTIARDRSVNSSRRKLVQSVSGAAIAALGATLIPHAAGAASDELFSPATADTPDVFRTLALFALFFSPSDLMAGYDDATLAKDFGFDKTQAADIANIRQIAQSAQGGYVRQQLVALFNKPIPQRPSPVYTGPQCPRDYGSLKKIARLSSGC